MERKVCSKCKLEKSVCEFSFRTKTNRPISTCKKCEIDRVKSYKEQNSTKVLESKKKYREKINKYFYNKRRTDSVYKLTCNYRLRIHNFLKKNELSKNDNTTSMIGCVPKQLKIHIENQFTDGMSWDNYGLFGWHIDHIVPLSSVKTEEDLYKLCHYTNLQPLWAKDNWSKSNKLDYL